MINEATFDVRLAGGWKIFRNVYSVPNIPPQSKYFRCNIVASAIFWAYFPRQVKHSVHAPHPRRGHKRRYQFCCFLCHANLLIEQTNSGPRIGGAVATGCRSRSRRGARMFWSMENIFPELVCSEGVSSILGRVRDREWEEHPTGAFVFVGIGLRELFPTTSHSGLASSGGLD